MKFILHKLLIIVVTAKSCSQSLFPDHEGCSELSHDTSNIEKCIHTVYCRQYVSSIRNTRHQQCRNVLYDHNNNEHDPVSIVINYDSSEHIVPRFGDSNDARCVYSLDLSDNNDAEHVPTLNYMESLAILKMLRSSLSTAKLSNEYELPTLRDIDYSENNINYIEIVPSEHVFKSLKKLNLSRNSLESIPDATFDFFPNIETLDLSHNFLNTLDTMSFEGIKQLLYLYLSYNSIQNLESSLQRLRYLTKLDLGYNILQVLKVQDFSKLVNLQDLKLNSNDIHTIEERVFNNMASLTTLDLQDNDLDTINQNLFINSTMLTSVCLSQNKLKALTINTFKGKTIFDFKIEGNRLEGPLRRGMFEGLGMVAELDLSCQHLTSIENYAFAGLQIIETLLLNNNDVESLGNYSFKGLQTLKCLDLSYNKISTVDIVSEDLISLQILSLHHNELSHISSNNFIALGSLQLLDLSYNNISYLGSTYFRSLQSLLNFKISNNPLCGSIDEKTFDGLSSLPSLDISRSTITKINNGSFMGMTVLKDLIISHSNVSELEYNSLSYASNIRTIDLSYNQLSAFDVNTTDLTNLDTLMLNNNLIQVISQTLFNGLRFLRTVILSHNNIRMIAKDTFSAAMDMRTLDLSYNPKLQFDVFFVEKAKKLADLIISGTKNEVTFTNINDISITKFEMSYLSIQNVSRLNLRKLQHLETLVLNNNAVSRLEISALSNLTSLKQLDLSYNKIDYIQPGTFKDTYYLELLNISHNMLLEITHGIFQGLMHLEVIDLSFNSLKDLHRSRFYDVDQLRTLIVDNNKIDFISDEDLLGTSLTKLSIGGNPLPCKMLYNIKRKMFHVSITAINIDESSGNLKGVTCNKDGYTSDSKNPETAESNKLLLDIRNILFNVSRAHIAQEPIEAKYKDPTYSESKTQQEQTISQHSVDIINSLKNLSSISNLTSIINSNTNLLLGKILRVLSAKEFLPTNKPVIVIKENGTSSSIISYIDKIKQDLENTLGIEKQNLLELDDKIEKLHSKLNFSMTTKTPVHKTLIKTNEDRQHSSMFTEVCVGIIMVILIGFILYKIYKSELYLPRGRSRASTNSTRNIAESMESAQL